MTAQTMVPHDKAVTLQILEALFLPENLKGIQVRLWDDTLWPGNEEANATLVLNFPGSLRAMLLPGTEVGIAEAYLNNDIDIEGSVEAIFDLAEGLINEVGSLRKKIKLISLLKQLPAVPVLATCFIHRLFWSFRRDCCQAISLLSTKAFLKDCFQD